MDGSAFLWYIEVKDTAKKRRKQNMDQKEIEALIAAGGAPCEICGGRMLKVDGCTWPGVYSRGKYYKRIKYGSEDFAWPDERCHDCGAKLGHYHHANCDVEQCPVCGGQLIGCNCEIEYTNDSPAEAQ